MPWLQLRIDATEDNAQQLSDAMEEAGAISVTLEDAADQILIEPDAEALPLWSRTRVVGLFDAASDVEPLKARLRALLGQQRLPGLQLKVIEDQDWGRAWMDRFEPVCFQNDLWVCPSWRTPPDPNACNIYLDPGLAFGTGTHASTALCLEWLGEQELTDKEIVDYGCGSGILAIAGLKRGARRAWGVDDDPRALAVSAGNAKKNEVSANYRPVPPESLPPGRQVDIVLANILLAPLVALAPRLTALVKPGGHLVLAGILKDQVSSLRPYYEGGFDLALRTREEWAMLAGAKRAPCDRLD